MVYVPYPQKRHDSNPDLQDWIAQKNHEGTNPWVVLRTYFSKHLDLNGTTIQYKCWFSETYQRDSYVQDVEHFRPKESAANLSPKHLKQLKDLYEIDLIDGPNGHNYSWLALEHRNYRPATASINRAGAKHIYFPIAADSQRLSQKKKPWANHGQEFPLLLDPCVKSDPEWLEVIADGSIKPIIPIEEVKSELFPILSQHWTSSTAGYVRASVSILLYRLQVKSIIDGRSTIINGINSKLINLALTLEIPVTEDNEIILNYIDELKNSCLPSAEFALAARCAMKNFVLDSTYKDKTKELISKIITTILTKVDEMVNALETE